MVGERGKGQREGTQPDTVVGEIRWSSFSVFKMKSTAVMFISLPVNQRLVRYMHFK